VLLLAILLLLLGLLLVWSMGIPMGLDRICYHFCRRLKIIHNNNNNNQERTEGKSSVLMGKMIIVIIIIIRLPGKASLPLKKQMMKKAIVAMMMMYTAGILVWRIRISLCLPVFFILMGRMDPMGERRMKVGGRSRGRKFRLGRG